MLTKTKILALLLFCGVAVAQPRIVPTGPYAPAGTTATVTYAMVGGGMNPAALQFTVPVPAGAVITPGAGLAAANEGLYYNVTAAGQATIVIASLTSATATVPDGPVATITFPSAPLQFSPTNAIAVNSQSDVVAFTVGSLNFGPSCDLNGDSKVDNADILLAINQTLGKLACVSADLVGVGQCTVQGTQRVLIASTGGSCRLGR
jgi:hypothetical protein